MVKFIPWIFIPIFFVVELRKRSGLVAPSGGPKLELHSGLQGFHDLDELIPSPTPRFDPHGKKGGRYGWEIHGEKLNFFYGDLCHLQYQLGFITSQPHVLMN